MHIIIIIINSEFLETFLGRIFQFLYTCKSSRDLISYNLSD